MTMTPLQVGRCGELMVQRRLLEAEVDSAKLTTDRRIDMVTYSPRTQKSLTIKVKTRLAPKPVPGTRQRALDWWVPEKCPADLVALADLSTDRIWLMTMAELPDAAQQHSKRGYHVCMHVDYIPPETAKTRPDIDFEKYLLGNRIEEFF